MEKMNCKICAYFNVCRRPKNKLCEAFIHDPDKMKSSGEIKKGEIKKG